MHVSPSSPPPVSPSPRSAFRYLERVEPIIFPVEAEVPETDLHFRLRVLLYQLLYDALGADVFVGSDQFVYWDASDPTKCAAPDVYVRLEPQTQPVTSWKVWQRGAPDVAVEIISDTDAGAAAWKKKLECYRHIGVRELLRFDPEDRQRVLRIWDRVDGALVEREVASELVPSSALQLYWAVAPAEAMPVALRIATGPMPSELVATASEARRAEERARRAAEERVRQLEDELKRRGG